MSDDDRNEADAALERIDELGVHQVYTGSGTGSGFLIDANHLLTNAHVVAPYREVAVERRDRTRISGTVRRLHPYRDLAIVQLAQPLPGEVLPISDEDGLKANESVHILGFPVGLPLSLTEGVISHPRQLLDEQFYVQTDAAINPGNSGGPMLDDQRRVIAVTTCKLGEADSVGFGIPASDVRRFVEEFRRQTASFGVQCPACEELITQAIRYCPRCGSDLEAQDQFADYFEASDLHPLVEFVERALAKAKVDPVLARHGNHNWSFHRGSAPIKVWCCCSEHLNFSSPLAQAGSKDLDALFAFLLDAGHAPFNYDIVGSTIRLNLVVHVSDVFTPSEHDELIERVTKFIDKADESDNVLIKQFGCEPASETQVEALTPGDFHRPE